MNLRKILISFLKGIYNNYLKIFEDNFEKLTSMNILKYDLDAVFRTLENTNNKEFLKDEAFALTYCTYFKGLVTEICFLKNSLLLIDRINEIKRS